MAMRLSLQGSLYTITPTNDPLLFHAGSFLVPRAREWNGEATIINLDDTGLFASREDLEDFLALLRSFANHPKPHPLHFTIDTWQVLLNRLSYFTITTPLVGTWSDWLYEDWETITGEISHLYGSGASTSSGSSGVAPEKEEVLGHIRDSLMRCKDLLEQPGGDEEQALFRAGVRRQLEASPFREESPPPPRPAEGQVVFLPVGHQQQTHKWVVEPFLAAYRHYMTVWRPFLPAKHVLWIDQEWEIALCECKNQAWAERASFRAPSDLSLVYDHHQRHSLFRTHVVDPSYHLEDRTIIPWEQIQARLIEDLLPSFPTLPPNLYLAGGAPWNISRADGGYSSYYGDLDFFAIGDGPSQVEAARGFVRGLIHGGSMTSATPSLLEPGVLTICGKDTKGGPLPIQVIFTSSSSITDVLLCFDTDLSRAAIHPSQGLLLTPQCLDAWRTSQVTHYHRHPGNSDCYCRLSKAMRKGFSLTPALREVLLASKVKEVRYLSHSDPATLLRLFPFLVLADVRRGRREWVDALDDEQKDQIMTMRCRRCERRNNGVANACRSSSADMIPVSSRWSKHRQFSTLQELLVYLDKVEWMPALDVGDGYLALPDTETLEVGHGFIPAENGAMNVPV